MEGRIIDFPPQLREVAKDAGVVTGELAEVTFLDSKRRPGTDEFGRTVRSDLVNELAKLYQAPDNGHVAYIGKSNTLIDALEKMMTPAEIRLAKISSGVYDNQPSLKDPDDPQAS